MQYNTHAYLVSCALFTFAVQIKFDFFNCNHFLSSLIHTSPHNSKRTTA